MKNILICTHYNKIQGLADIFFDYCLSKDDLENTIFLKNPLSRQDKLKSKIILYKNSKKIDEIDFPSLSYFRFPIVWILNLYYLKKIMAKHKIAYFDYFFAFDPLQYFYSFFYRNFIKILKKIFYSSDYAEKRFKKIVLNSIYVKIDRVSLKDCDLYIVGSNRVLKIREEQGKNKEQLYLAPQPFDKNNVIFKDIRGRTPFSLIFIGNIQSPSVDFKYIFDGMVNLKKTKYPDIKFYIFGDGNLIPEYKKYVNKLGIDKVVLFLGIKKHEELFRELNKYWIGLCPYAVSQELKSWHTAYGSLFTTKMIEYVANGTPFLTTAIHDNVHLFEEWKVGRVINPDKQSFIENIDFFFSNRKTLEEYSTSCYKISEKYSSDIVYGRLFKKLGD